MNRSISEPPIEVQGSGECVSGSDQKRPTDRSELRTDTETYRTMLARELFVNDMQEDCCKSF